MSDTHTDVKTTDGYLFYLLCVGFTKKNHNSQTRKAPHAPYPQVPHIWKKMMEIRTREVQANDLKEYLCCEPHGKSQVTCKKWSIN